MKENKIEAIDILDRIIIGRVEPHIYAFTTNTVPNYLKVGDTYRPCLLYTSPSPRDKRQSRMPSSA